VPELERSNLDTEHRAFQSFATISDLRQFLTSEMVHRRPLYKASEMNPSVGDLVGLCESKKQLKLPTGFLIPY